MHWLNKSWYDYSLDPEDQINLTGRQCPSGDRGGQVKKKGKNRAMLIKKEKFENGMESGLVFRYRSFHQN